MGLVKYPAASPEQVHKGAVEKIFLYTVQQILNDFMAEN